MMKEFVKNILDTDTDGLRGINTYTIYAVYEVEYEDDFGSYFKTEQEIVDRFDYTWKEIDRDGGLASVLKEIHEEYNITSKEAA